MNWNSIAALVIHGVPVCIYGNPGVGKTSRMGQLFDQMAQMMLLSLISQSKTTPVEVEKKLLQALFGQTHGQDKYALCRRVVHNILAGNYTDRRSDEQIYDLLKDLYAANQMPDIVSQTLPAQRFASSTFAMGRKDLYAPGESHRSGIRYDTPTSSSSFYDDADPVGFMSPLGEIEPRLNVKLPAERRTNEKIAPITYLLLRMSMVTMSVTEIDREELQGIPFGDKLIRRMSVALASEARQLFMEMFDYDPGVWLFIDEFSNGDPEIQMAVSAMMTANNFWGERIDKMHLFIAGNTAQQSTQANSLVREIRSRFISVSYSPTHNEVAGYLYKEANDKIKKLIGSGAVNLSDLFKGSSAASIASGLTDLNRMIQIGYSNEKSPVRINPDVLAVQIRRVAKQLEPLYGLFEKEANSIHKSDYDFDKDDEMSPVYCGRMVENLIRGLAVLQTVGAPPDDLYALCRGALPEVLANEAISVLRNSRRFNISDLVDAIENYNPKKVIKVISDLSKVELIDYGYTLSAAFLYLCNHIEFYTAPPNTDKSIKLDVDIFNKEARLTEKGKTYMKRYIDIISMIAEKDAFVVDYVYPPWESIYSHPLSYIERLISFAVRNHIQKVGSSLILVDHTGQIDDNLLDKAYAGIKAAVANLFTSKNKFSPMIQESLEILEPYLRHKFRDYVAQNRLMIGGRENIPDELKNQLSL